MANKVLDFVIKDPTALMLFLWLAATTSAFAQTEDVEEPDSVLEEQAQDAQSETYQVTIPYYQFKSPEASAFRKYGEYAVNEYTGSPNISVPIYTLNYKDIEIPLTLTYDASGIQVDQEASWVGLGWNLMVGGCINYVAAGEVDPRTLYSTPAEWETFASQGSGSAPMKTFTSNLIVEKNGVINVDESKVDDLSHGYGETDYFSVNLLGQSFLFFYDRTANQYKIIGDASGIFKIEDEINVTYDKIDNARWKITDGNGVQYYFIPGEKTNALGFQSLYTSSWYLSEIVTPEGSQVQFGYTSDTYLVPWRVNLFEQFDFVINTEAIAIPLHGTGMVQYPGQGYHSSLTASAYNVHTRYLTSIITTSETVTFTLGDRADLTNAKRLEKITVKSNISNQTVREFKFNYSYFTASTVGGDMPNNRRGTFSYADDLGKRLKLTSMDECGGSTTLRTSFEYNESTKLPLKTSAAKDFWGYFNNSENNINGRLTLLPTPRFLLSESDSHMNDQVLQYAGANRYCNETSMKAAVLQKIIYPTKGYTTFTYEAHKFVSTQRYPASGYFSTFRKNATITDRGDSPATNSNSHYQLDLSGKGVGTITVTFSGQLSDLFTASPSANVTITPMNPNIGSAQTFDLSLASEYQRAYGSSFTKKISLKLPANSYMVTVYCPKLGSTYSVSASLDVTVIPNSSNTLSNIGGGLRIRKIANYNHDNTLQDSTAYHYTDADGGCSGRLLRPMLHYEKKDILREVQGSGESSNSSAGISRFTILRLKQSSSAMPTFSATLSGGVVGYSTVTKQKYNADGSLLQTVTSNYSNTVPNQYYNRYYYGTSSNGQLISQTVKGTDDSVLKEVRNTYTQTSSTFGHILLMEDRVINERMVSHAAADFPRYVFWHYPFSYKWSRLSQTKTLTYDGNVTQDMTTTYVYNAKNHQVSKETTNSSNSNVSYVTEYKYPSDFTASPYNLMSNTTNFIHYPVIEQSLSVVEGGTTKLAKKRTETYTGYTNKCRDIMFNNRVFLPTATKFVLDGDTLEQRMTYAYNNRCDRVSITKDSEKVTYLWAYNYMYPVAEIKGATYSDLTSWGLSTHIKNLGTKTTTTDVQSVLATIRTALAGRTVLMTSYTYDPLVGITSMTAPNGTVTSYTYDALGRLSTVKNHNGDIIQQHSYHYK